MGVLLPVFYENYILSDVALNSDSTPSSGQCKSNRDAITFFSDSVNKISFHNVFTQSVCDYFINIVTKTGSFRNQYKIIQVSNIPKIADTIGMIKEWSVILALKNAGTLRS